MIYGEGSAPDRLTRLKFGTLLLSHSNLYQCDTLKRNSIIFNTSHFIRLVYIDIHSRHHSEQTKLITVTMTSQNKLIIARADGHLLRLYTVTYPGKHMMWWFRCYFLNPKYSCVMCFETLSHTSSAVLQKRSMKDHTHKWHSIYHSVQTYGASTLGVYSRICIMSSL